MNERIDYWIETDDAGENVAVLFRNADSRAVVGESERRGPFKVLRCRLWARRHGYGWLPVGEPPI